ncbi:MAG TPA: hypothetical protein PKC96_04225 [Bacilli bacterium]|nr:hypothetical protein [Bacilli bacterium]
MTKIFNTDLEISLRILILLYVSKKSHSVDTITALDLFTTYGKNYNLLESNLHGDSSYSFSEIASRRKLITQALKTLVTKGMIKPLKNQYGFLYQINNHGIWVCENMEGDYFNKYVQSLSTVIRKTSNMSETELVNYATKSAVGRE